METTQAHYNRWLHGYATFLAAVTFLLIVAGALVTSNDAGLSVPDWPTSFGSFRMPRMVGGILYEHGHRMIAGTVGLLTIVLGIWLWLKEPRRWMRRLGGIAVLAVMAQAVLGGITVLFYLPVVISVSHATLAQLFFCIVVSLSLFTRADWRWDEPKLEEPSVPSLCHLAAATTASILLQLVLGAAFRHSGLGIAPHLVGAAVVAVLAAWVAWRVLAGFRREPRLLRHGLALVVLLGFQIFLGIGSYLMKLASRDAPQPQLGTVAVTTTHVAAGALVLAVSLMVTLEAYRTLAAPRGERLAQRASAPESASL